MNRNQRQGAMPCRPGPVQSGLVSDSDERETRGREEVSLIRFSSGLNINPCSLRLELTLFYCNQKYPKASGRGAEVKNRVPLKVERKKEELFLCLYEANSAILSWECLFMHEHTPSK